MGDVILNDENILTIIFYSVAEPDKLPGTVDISNVTTTSLSLQWQSPRKDGGSPITGYKVEMTSDEVTWSEVETTGAETTRCKVSDLTTGSKYRFRVSAVNKVGIGKASQSEDILLKKPVGECWINCSNRRWSFVAADTRHCTWCLILCLSHLKLPGLSPIGGKV